jgi:hypothetical protein
LKPGDSFQVPAQVPAETPHAGAKVEKKSRIFLIYVVQKDKPLRRSTLAATVIERVGLLRRTSRDLARGGEWSSRSLVREVVGPSLDSSAT